MYIPKGVSFTIGFFVAFLYGLILSAPRIGLLIAAILSIVKEIDDQYQYQCFDWTTTVATMCGAAIAYMILSVIAIF